MLRINVKGKKSKDKGQETALDTDAAQDVLPDKPIATDLFGKSAGLAEQEQMVKSVADTGASPFVLTVSIDEDSIEALNHCLEALDETLPFSLVVFPTANFKSDLLKKAISAPDHLTVSSIKKTTKLAANHVYLVPPAAYFTLESGVLQHQDEDTSGFSPTDRFLTSKADRLGANAVVLLFTSLIESCSEGLKCVREADGVVFQLNYAGLNAIENQQPIHSLLVDASKPAREIATRVNAIAATSSDAKAAGLSLQQEDIQSLEHIYMSVHRVTGIRCSDFDLIFILKHIQQRLKVLGEKSITTYAAFLKDHPIEVWLLARRLSLHLSGILHEMATMQTVIKDVIPEVFNANQSGTVRAWVPACSTGEDTLAIAMYLSEYAEKQNLNSTLSCIGSDIDEKVLQHARKAHFGSNCLHKLPKAMQAKYFEKTQDRFVMNRQLVQQTHFSFLDLVNTAPYANINLIYYRGHLKKLKKEVQLKVLKNIHNTLAEDGFLIVGEGETIGKDVGFFKQVDANGLVFKPVISAKKATATQHTVNLFRKQGDQATPAADVDPVKVETTNVDTGSTHVASAGSSGVAKTPINQLHRDLLLQIQNPISVIVDAEFNILDQQGHIGQFIAWPNNGKTANLLTAFPEEVRNDLQDAVRQAIKAQKNLKSKVLEPNHDGILRPFRLQVRPIDLFDDEKAAVQVMFIDPDQPQNVSAPQSVKGQQLSAVVKKLETDLRHAKDRLNTLTRQLEAAKENQGAAPAELQPKVVKKLQQQNNELKTTNKELLALNRDLVRRVEELRKRTQEAMPKPAPTPEKEPATNPAADSAVSALLSKQILKLTTNRHEIRTALTSIMGFADLLAERQVDADNKELARYISKAGNRLSDSISNLLDGDFEEYEVFDQPKVVVQEEAGDPISDRLLVVEDSDATRRLLSLVLSDHFECELAADASEAIEKAKKERFKAVLMDINLGAGQSGVDVLQHLRQQDPYQRVPFMAVTAMASPKDESLLRGKGFNAYLAKPFHKSALLSTLDKMLSETPIA